ncbi:allantoate amidohydrolase [Bordetella bronchialis]|uniref:Zn-dependent hydrolase n=1 Tax=Bordetella bronchialis TaxID=463025 RepID=A0A193FSH8_9BORD|nr:allantoate amidohydrolase [Bordetella bronchialis]ANN69296.1 Zn-dependent hydrolase [Bordetella bronchialis]ANN70024.1 Zn-dependent hydrolase [Bordetella bronchialis]
MSPIALPARGERVLRWADALARHSDHAEHLTCAYMTPAHRAVAALLETWMREAGFDEVRHDAVGNVIGRYRAAPGQRDAMLVATGSHYDTVRNGGRYDGRLGILLPIAIVADLHAQGRRLPFDLEVIGFAEEEGLRFGGSFLGSSAYVGRFDPGVLDHADADGVPLREALRQAGFDPARAGAPAEPPAGLVHYFEIHIEQGPVLLDRGLAVGVVSAIAGSVRRLLTLHGRASHAGTTPMGLRHDAACAAAEIVLAVERRCGRTEGLVGTVGRLEVPNGSINVIPGCCQLSLDVRAPDDKVRDAALADIDAEIAAICHRRGVRHAMEEIMRVPATPCAPAQRALWSAAIAAHGVPVHELPSGAGHDAMMVANVAPVSMLFVRCGNGGISHNPLESVTSEDVQLAGQVAETFLLGLARVLEQPARQA